MRGAEVGEGDAIIAVRELEDEPLAGGPPDRLDLNAGGVRAGQEVEQLAVVDGRDVEPLVFGEELLGRVPGTGRCSPGSWA